MDYKVAHNKASNRLNNFMTKCQFIVVKVNIKCYLSSLLITNGCRISSSTSTMTQYHRELKYGLRS